MLVALLFGLMGTSVAGPVDVYGFGAKSIGRGQGGVSVADGGMTVFRNPALLQKLEWAEATVGYGLYRGSFPEGPDVYWDTNRDGLLDSSDTPLQVKSQSPSSDAVSLSMSRNVGTKVGLGINAFLPTSQFLRLHTTEPALPTWVMYENRNQRFEIAVGLGAEIYRGISVGASAELIAQARYQINATLNVAAGTADDNDPTGEDLIDYVTVDIHEMTLDLVPRFIPVFGLHWDVGELAPPLEGLYMGAAWRGSSGVPVDASIDLQLNGSVFNDMDELDPMYVTLLMPVELSIFDHYVPQRLSLGASYDYKQRVMAYVDLHHSKWSEMQVNVAHVTESKIRSQLIGVNEDLLDDANDYDAVFTNTLSVHGGLEVYLPEIDVQGEAGSIAPVIRGGMGLIPSPLQSQGAGTAFLDADRMLFSAGLGVSHDDPFGLVPGPVSWDMFFTAHRLASGELKPAGTTNIRPGAPVDGAAFPIGGKLWSTGVEMAVSF
ncbi:MAG: OmpP1/FadL family transporter [Myxococcota bacterium]